MKHNPRLFRIKECTLRHDYTIKHNIIPRAVCQVPDAFSRSSNSRSSTASCLTTEVTDEELHECSIVAALVEAHDVLLSTQCLTITPQQKQLQSNAFKLHQALIWTVAPKAVKTAS